MQIIFEIDNTSLDALTSLFKRSIDSEFERTSRHRRRGVKASQSATEHRYEARRVSE